MGLFSRVIIRADNYDSDDENEYNAHYNDTHRRTVHGSRERGALSESGGWWLGRSAQPRGFLSRDSGRPRHSGERP